MKSRSQVYSELARISLTEFPEIVRGTELVEGKLRLLLDDESFIDVWLSEKRKGIYAYHWERRAVNGTIYRHNNLPDIKARKLKTFPKHFHEGTENVVKESNISNVPEQALRTILEFVEKILKPK